MGAHRILRRVWQCSKGVAAIEYALMAGTISTIIIFTVASVGKQVGNSFQHTAAELAAMSGSGGGNGSPANNDENSGGGDVAPVGNDSASGTGNSSDTGSNNGNNCSSNGKGKAKGKGQNC